MWHSVKEKKKTEGMVPTTTTTTLPPDHTTTIKPAKPTSGNKVITSDGYGYDQGGYDQEDYSSVFNSAARGATNLTGPVPNRGGSNGAVPMSENRDASDWPPVASNTNASSPWTPQHHPPTDSTHERRQHRSAPGGGDRGRNPPLTRRQSSEKPPRPRQPPRRQSTEGERPERPPPPRRQSTESSTSSNQWGSQDRSDPWQPQYEPSNQHIQQSSSPWSQSRGEETWEPTSKTERSRQSPDPWARGPTIAPTNPFYSAFEESQNQ